MYPGELVHREIGLGARDEVLKADSGCSGVNFRLPPARESYRVIPSPYVDSYGIVVSFKRRTAIGWSLLSPCT